MDSQAAQEVLGRFEYIFFVFWTAVSVIQLAATKGGLKGLLFVRKPSVSYLFWSASLVGAYLWFFLGGDRIDTIMRRTGIEGSGQFYYFCVGSFFAIVFTLVASSLLNSLLRREIRHNPDSNGIDLLKNMSYWQGLKHSFRKSEEKDDRPLDPALDK